MKKLMSCLLLLSSLFIVTTGFTSGDKEITIKKVNLQVLSTRELDDVTIGLYTSSGWTYNEESQQLEREVTYEDEEINVDGKTYTTDDNGEVEVNLNKINSPNLNISSEMITDSEGQNQQIINKSSLNNGDQIIIQETVDVDQVIKSMDDSTMNESEITNQTSNGMTQVGGLSNGQLPSHGQYVHCNRFNGYLGNGRYYSKTANPVMAARNFVQSDCDVALAKSTKCLADYGSNPYCSTANTSTAGKCSPNIVGHSRLYHKHTGFFSPSK